MIKITKNKIPDSALGAEIAPKALSGGYSILELLFYISFFATFALLTINAMIIMTKSFKETSIYGELAQGGVIMERISREIRQAYAINSISASNLFLNTKDSLGADRTARFELSGTDIHFLENDILVGNLNSPNIIITALSFTQISTAEGEAVKIVLSIRSSNDNSARVFDFHNTIILRNTYL